MPTLNVIGIRFGAIGGNGGSVADSPFIMTINTANTSTGSSGNNQYRLPTIATGTYNMTVDWGDGSSNVITVWNQAERLHTYAVAGIKTITITGVCNGWLHASTGTDRLKTISISQWGNGWVLTPATFTANGAFFNNQNFVSITATDAPILTSSMYQAFRGCPSLSTFSNIGNWNVSGVTNMQAVFYGCNLFNTNINAWDVSNVTNMQSLFQAANAFNQPLNNWDVSNVTNMSSMFYACLVFNQDITNWNVSNVTNMNSMFFLAQLFNQNINSWNVSQVQNFGSMFSTLATGSTMIFNQPLNNWNTSSATNMSSMFAYNTAFNQDISAWDVSQVTTTQTMFRGATSFSQPINNWNLASITTMNAMFLQLSNFNVALNNWTIGSSINNMALMFSQCSSFNQYLNWTFAAKPTNQGVETTNLFQDCFAFNNGGQPFTWTIRIGTQANGMFSRCTVFNQNVGSIQFSANTRNLSTMFYECTAFNNGGSADINNWDLTPVTGTINAQQMFYDCTSFNQPLNNLFSVAKVNNTSFMFAGCTALNSNVGNWKFGTDVVAGQVLVDGMFVGCTAFNNGGSTDINNWDFTTVTQFGTNGFYQMFQNCTSFNQPLNNWDVSKCPSFIEMFFGCTSFNQPLNNWTFSSSLFIEVYGMFAGCSSFNQHIDWVLPLGGVALDYMFSGCTLFNNGGQDMPLQQIFGGSFGIYSYYLTFSGCTSFNQKINYDGATYVDPWQGVTTTQGMFQECAAFNNGGAPLPLDMIVNENCSGMFFGCTSFNQNVGALSGLGIQTNYICDFSGMFDGCTIFNNGGSSDISQPLACQFANMSFMFNNAPAFNQNLQFWMTGGVTDLNGDEFMAGKTPVTLPAVTYDALLNGWFVGVDGYGGPSNVTISFGTAKYSAAAATSHDDLINNYGWTIVDGGLV